MDQIFRNQLVIDKIFRYLVGQRLNFLMLTREVSEYLGRQVLVEFSITKYLLWIISSKSYEPMSFIKLLYWDVVPMYIPSKVMDDLDSILQFLKIEHFQRLRVVLRNREVSRHQISSVELSNRLSSYLMLGARLKKHFYRIEEIVVEGMTLKLDLLEYRPRYINLAHTRIATIPDSVEGLVIDIKNMPTDIVLPRLRRLKLLDNPHFSFNYLRFFQRVKWEKAFPNLEYLYIGMFHVPAIDLRGLKRLRKVFARPDTTFQIGPHVVLDQDFDQHEYNRLFECPLINQNQLFKGMIETSGGEFSDHLSSCESRSKRIDRCLDR